MSKKDIIEEIEEMQLIQGGRAKETSNPPRSDEEVLSLIHDAAKAVFEACSQLQESVSGFYNVLSESLDESYSDDDDDDDDEEEDDDKKKNKKKDKEDEDDE